MPYETVFSATGWARVAALLYCIDGRCRTRSTTATTASSGSIVTSPRRDAVRVNDGEEIEVLLSSRWMMDA